MLLRAGLWLMVGITLGRLAGFIREAILARQFGTSAQADVAVLALTLPDAILNVLIGSAMGAMLVPALARAGAQQPDQRNHLMTQVLLIAMGATIVLYGVCWLGDRALIALIAPGLPATQIAQLLPLIAIALLAMPLTMASAVYGAALQERYRFAMTSLGALVFNGTIITGLLIGAVVATPDQRLQILVWSLVGGAGLRVLLQVIDWQRSGGALRVSGPWLVDRRMLIGYVQVMCTGAAVLLVPLLGRRYASDLGDGAIATFTYASKLFELPLAVLITVVSSAIFPRLSQLAAGSTPAERNQGDQLMGTALRLVLVLALASAIGMGWFASELAGLAFGRSLISDDGVQRIGGLTALMLIALPAAGITSVITTWCNARGDTRSPCIVSAMAVVLFLIATHWLSRNQHLHGLAVAVIVLHLATAAPLLLLAWVHIRCPLWPLVRQGALTCLTTAVGAAPACGLSLLVADPTVRVLLAGVAIVGGTLAGIATVPHLRQLILNRLRRS